MKLRLCKRKWDSLLNKQALQYLQMLLGGNVLDHSLKAHWEGALSSTSILFWKLAERCLDFCHFLIIIFRRYLFI